MTGESEQETRGAREDGGPKERSEEGGDIAGFSCSALSTPLSVIFRSTLCAAQLAALYCCFCCSGGAT